VRELPLVNGISAYFQIMWRRPKRYTPWNFERWNMMRWMTLAVLVGAMGSAAAQPADSIVATGPLLTGCRALVENDPNGDQMQMGACAGAVRATADISRALRRACPPMSDVVIEAARTVIMFVDERPERKSEEFGPLALTAIGYRWPC
jgi:Rap1a immunity proteins